LLEKKAGCTRRRIWLRRYAVLFDVDRKMVAAYAIVGERLKRAPLVSLSGACSWRR
jgi:hypothetical protein